MAVGVAAAMAQQWVEDLLATAVYARLHTGDPGPSGIAHESVGDPSFKACNFAAITGGGTSLTNTPSWTNAATSETLTHLSLWAGNTVDAIFLLSIALDSSQAWASTNTYTLATLALLVTPQAA